MKGSEIIVKTLEDLGIDTISGIPGGYILPFYDALSRSGIKHVLARHEQGAGFIAQGYARRSGRAGVCVATSGPGATNLLTAVADAKHDSVPLLVITGQVPIRMIGSDAFQEVDTVGIFLPVTKHSFLVRRIEELEKTLIEAYHLALEGRPGPVLVDIPKNIQEEEYAYQKLSLPEDEKQSPDSESVQKIINRINSSERGVIFAGGGAVTSECREKIESLSKKTGFPVATSLMGIGSASVEESLSLGMVGMHGRMSTNLAFEEADLVIALGVRFNDRSTGRASEFCRSSDIIHIDIDDSEIDKIKMSNISLKGDIRSALEKIIPLIEEKDSSEWRRRIEELKSLDSDDCPDSIFHPERVLSHIRECAPEAAIATDVGQHQMWVATRCRFSKPRTLLTSGGLGTMGFGLPAAIGAALADSESVICISGDGSIMMNIQELATLAELDLDVKIIIFNNSALGLVRQQQELFYSKNFFASKYGTRTDFAKIAEGFGIRGVSLHGEIGLTKLTEALKSRGPVLIDIPIEQELNVFPMVPPGRANRETIGGRL